VQASQADASNCAPPDTGHSVAQDDYQRNNEMNKFGWHMTTATAHHLHGEQQDSNTHNTQG